MSTQPIRGQIPEGVTEISTGVIFALIIGISDYRNINDLRFADHDALAFRSYLLQSNFTASDSQRIELF
ncbi:MAG: caspase family protein [Saprospiraceae bacterium]|nr:caspase family protein [Saprospiraceae bacterium]